MFKLRNITVKNFLSVGNQTQAVDFDKEHLTLVLGSNLDLGGDDTGSRNGTGKTTMINALSYGAPPHGGIAPGIDRIVMLLANEKNIREVTMFPMNQNAQDLMMKAPSDVSEDQLKELGIAIKNKK